MTKKDYVLIAKAFKQTDPRCNNPNDYAQGEILQWNRDIDFLREALDRDKPAFDRQKFLAACGF